MLKCKIIQVEPPKEVKKHLRLPEEVFSDHFAILNFVSQIGEESVRYISTFGEIIGNYCTIFYETERLVTCPDCQWDYSPEHAFCVRCGKALVPITQPEPPACVHCGKPLLPTSNLFCPACGQRQPEPPKKKGLFD